MALDLTSIEKAVGSLERSLGVVHSSEFMDKLSQAQKELVRAGVIQNFGCAFERCWKFMNRWLGQNLGSATVDGVTRKELFRLAAEHRLIERADDWFRYHEARNETAHTYDQNKAEAVFQTAGRFLHDAKKFYEALKKHND